MQSLIAYLKLMIYTHEKVVISFSMGKIYTYLQNKPSYIQHSSRQYGRELHTKGRDGQKVQKKFNFSITTPSVQFILVLAQENTNRERKTINGQPPVFWGSMKRPSGRWSNERHENPKLKLMKYPASSDQYRLSSWLQHHDQHTSTIPSSWKEETECIKLYGNRQVDQGTNGSNWEIQAAYFTDEKQIPLLLWQSNPARASGGSPRVAFHCCKEALCNILLLSAIFCQYLTDERKNLPSTKFEIPVSKVV